MRLYALIICMLCSFVSMLQGMHGNQTYVTKKISDNVQGILVPGSSTENAVTLSIHSDSERINYCNESCNKKSVTPSSVSAVIFSDVMRGGLKIPGVLAFILHTLVAFYDGSFDAIYKKPMNMKTVSIMGYIIPAVCEMIGDALHVEENVLMNRTHNWRTAARSCYGLLALYVMHKTSYVPSFYSY